MSYKQLTLRERYEIKALLQAGTSKDRIAEIIGFHRSSIYREIGRNGGKDFYDPVGAQRISDARRSSARKSIRFTDDVKERVESLLRYDFSPEQISGYLSCAEGISISHETIYQHVLADKSSGGDLHTHLRWSGKKRRKRYGKKDRRGQIPDRVSIDERPAIVDTKERYGDWEVDTMIGKNYKGVLVTAVERKAKYSCIGHAPWNIDCNRRHIQELSRISLINDVGIYVLYCIVTFNVVVVDEAGNKNYTCSTVCSIKGDAAVIEKAVCAGSYYWITRCIVSIYW